MESRNFMNAQIDFCYSVHVEEKTKLFLMG
jgi:hypothetical protein